MNFESLEVLLRKAVNSVGIDLKRHRPSSSPAGRLAAMLGHHDVDLVLDVGANAGQFASDLRRGGFSARMLSFEPLASAHARLLSASRNDDLWEIAPQVAIGDQEGDIEIHVAGNSVSSSVLQMLDSHATAAPASKYVASERVRLATLDTMLRDLRIDSERLFLKIDTQGYEDRVLNGATETLTRVCGIQMELSFLPLYEGQQLFDPLVQRLHSLGFSIWAIWPGFCDTASGRMLQVDVVAFKG